MAVIENKKIIEYGFQRAQRHPSARITDDVGALSSDPKEYGYYVDKRGYFIISRIASMASKFIDIINKFDYNYDYIPMKTIAGSIAFEDFNVPEFMKDFIYFKSLRVDPATLDAEDFLIRESKINKTKDVIDEMELKTLTIVVNKFLFGEANFTDHTVSLSSVRINASLLDHLDKVCFAIPTEGEKGEEEVYYCLRSEIGMVRFKTKSLLPIYKIPFWTSNLEENNRTMSLLYVVKSTN